MNLTLRMCADESASGPSGKLNFKPCRPWTIGNSRAEASKRLSTGCDVKAIDDLLKENLGHDLISGRGGMGAVVAYQSHSTIHGSIQVDDAAVSAGKRHSANFPVHCLDRGFALSLIHI